MSSLHVKGEKVSRRSLGEKTVGISVEMMWMSSEMAVDKTAFLGKENKKTPCFRMRFSCLFDAWQLYAGLPARRPPGITVVLCKSVPDGFVLLRRVLTDKQQIKQKAQSFD
ncbi:hypothetical protein ACLBW2_12480 [Enterobacteriaceae bacterium C23F]